jgi:hypothetical protein
MAIQKIASDKNTSVLPFNIVSATVGHIPVRALIDTGASLSVLSGDIFKRIRKNAYTVKPKATNDKLLAADSTPMPVTAEITTDVRIAGLGVPCTFSVVQNLGFEAILGIDFLKEAHAVIDIKNNTLSLCDGLIAVPLITAVDHVTVSTATAVKLPPFSETILMQ